MLIELEIKKWEGFLSENRETSERGELYSFVARSEKKKEKKKTGKKSFRLLRFVA